VSIKYFLLLATLLICSCESLKVSGNYQYTQGKENINRNDLTLTYSNNIIKTPVIITGRANHDPLFKDKPSFQETSIETWFW
jgi:hypothetical protein